jgi:hypothetical protein
MQWLNASMDACSLFVTVKQTVLFRGSARFFPRP